jgi:hypothetical protein
MDRQSVSVKMTEVKEVLFALKRSFPYTILMGIVSNIGIKKDGLLSHPARHLAPLPICAGTLPV